MKKLSLRSIVLGVIVGLAMICAKGAFVASTSRLDLEGLREKVIACSDNSQKDKFFFAFKYYLFFVTRQDEEVTVRVFRILGTSMATYKCDLKTGNIWEQR